VNLQDYLTFRHKTHLIFDLDETLVHLIFPWDDWERPIKEELLKVDKSILYDPKIPKENYLFIGDSKSDREVAKKLGIDFYFVDFFKKKGISYFY